MPADSYSAWDSETIEFDEHRAVPNFIDILPNLPEELQAYIVTHIPEFSDYDKSNSVRKVYGLVEAINFP